MNRSDCRMLVLVFLASGLALFGVACSKKVAPPMATNLVAHPAPPPPVPAPTISLSASPSTITRGQSTTLSWSSSNTTSVSIDGGIGSVPSSGQRTVTPSASETFTATARGAGGESEASARITVIEPQPSAPPPKPISDEEFFNSKVQDIYFDFDKSDIRPDQQPRISEDASALSERLNIKFRIEGNCDERGSEKYNLALGDRRANTAKEFLTEQGISANRIETISYGKERPVCTEHDETRWQKNRHDHFVMLMH